MMFEIFLLVYVISFLFVFILGMKAALSYGEFLRNSIHALLPIINTLVAVMLLFALVDVLFDTLDSKPFPWRKQ